MTEAATMDQLADSPVCRATKNNGERCTRLAQPGKPTCWSHDPDNAEQRRLNSRAGGKAALGARSPMAAELRGVKEELRSLAADVREGKIAPPIGTTLVQIYNVLLRCLSEERKAKELDELEARIDRLEKGTR